MILLLSIVAVTLPMMGYLAFVWWLDRYEREPVWLVELAYLWGATGGIVLAVIGTVAAGATVSAATALVSRHGKL